MENNHDFWLTMAAVSGALFLVSFALAAFASSSSRLFVDLTNKRERRIFVYYAIFLAAANLVAIIVTSLNWLLTAPMRLELDFYFSMFENVFWLLLFVMTAAIIPPRATLLRKVVRSVIFFGLLAWNVWHSAIALRDEVSAAQTATFQLFIATVFPLTVVLYAVMRRDFPKLSAWMDK